VKRGSWLIASDSDPKRSPALYLLCMSRALSPADPLYLVEKLRGMNLYTGVNGITQDLDVKHDLNHEYFSLNYV
jgi:hypothetical protein